MRCLTDYDIKILLAFHESLKGNKKFGDYLLQSEFPELTALSNAIQSDIEALYWLLQNNFPEFGILSNAIDNEEYAIKWLQKYDCRFLDLFAAACRQEDEAIRWFVKNDLRIFIDMIMTIHEILLHQSYDSSDVHKLRKS